MIDQFSDLIKLSNACCNFSELTTSTTEVNALREGVSRFVPTKIFLPNNQLKILISDETTPLINYIVNPSTGTLSAFGRDLIESTISINPDYLYLFEYFSRFDNSNPPKNYNEILSEKLDPLSYFLFAQELFDSFSTIPLNMNDAQDALSDIIRYVLLHTKNLSLTENISKLNIEILKIAKKIQGTNLSMFKPLFQECFVRSIIHNNRISKESIKESLKCLLESSGASKATASQLISENESGNTLLHQIIKLVYYESYLKQDKDHIFYPFDQGKGEIIEQAKAKTNVLIEKTGNILTKGTLANGCYVLKIIVNWEKKFKGTRLSNASFIEITYQKIKQTFEINGGDSPNSNDQPRSSENDKKKDKDKDKNKRKSSNDVHFSLENPYIEAVFPAFTKADDKIEISLLYVKEKFTDTNRKKVPPEGIGTLASFTFPLNPSSRKPQAGNQKTKSSKSKSESDFELNVIHSDSDEQPFVVEFKRKEKALSTRCGSISLQSKYYDLQGENVPDLFQNNLYFQNRYSDNLQLQQFLDFYIGNLVNEWIMGKPYRMTSTGSTSILMSIYPPQEYYVGLIEFSTRYSIPASTIFLHISKNLLNAWCHAECYLNAFTAMFLSAHVCIMNNEKKIGSKFLNDEEEELYNYIIKVLEKNVPMFMIQHLSKPALYQRHALLPLFMLLSFVIPDDKIDSYVETLVETSHKNIIRSVTGYLKPTKVDEKEKTSKVLPEVENLMKYVDTKKYDIKNILNDENKEEEETKNKKEDENEDVNKIEVEIVNNINNDNFNDLDLSKITFSIEAISETLDILNKRTKQLSKFYEDSSLPNFINQWESIKGELCQFTLALIKMYMTKQNKSDCIDQSVFKIIFSYRELYSFFSENVQIEEEEEDKGEEITNHKNQAEDDIEDDIDDNGTIITRRTKKVETISDKYSPFKLFFDVILDWISKIGEQMIIWTTNAVKYDTFEIEDKKFKTSSSPRDLMEVFRQSFNFIGSLHWDDPNIEMFVMTFLSLCGSCMRNYTDTLTMKMLSYFPIKVIREAKVEAIWHYISDLEAEQKSARKQSENQENEKTIITPRKIFVIINDFVNLRQMWNNFLLYVKKLFPSFFPGNDNNETEIPLSAESSSFNSSTLFASSPSIDLPPQVMDPVPKLTGISNSIPTLFSRLTSHLVTDTISPHLWVKNSTMKQVLVKKASQFILNPEFFKTGSPIYASIFDKILLYIKERVDDINATTCMRYYKTMIVSFLFGLDSGMMNLLVMHPSNDEPIKNKRLIPILNFIQGIYREVFQYINETAIEQSFARDEKLENYTPHSDFMFKHISDDAEKLVDFVNTNYSSTTIYNANENDPEFLTVMCAFIIISSQTNDKRQKVKDWVHNIKSRFIGKHFYPPKYK